MEESNNGKIILWVIVIGVVFLLWLRRRNKKKKEAALKAENKKFFEDLQAAANAFNETGIEPMESDIKLVGDEKLYLVMRGIKWSENRKVKGADHLTAIDKGDLYLTDKKFIFRGSGSNKNIPHNKILAIKPYTNGFDVERDAGKAVFFEYNFKENLAPLARILYINKAAE